ncbi:uncharacterized protein LOC144438993 [Glandiceps talaboti]
MFCRRKLCSRKCLEYMLVFILFLSLQGLLTSLNSPSIESCDHSVDERRGKGFDEGALQIRQAWIKESEKSNSTGATTTSDVLQGDLIKTLQSIRSDLGEVRFHVRDRETVKLVQKSLSSVGYLLNALKRHSNDTKDPVIDSGYVEPKLPRNVCPEEYKGPLYDYPFRNKGFEPIKCNNSKPLHTLVSVLLNFKEPGGKREKIRNVLKGIERVYPRLTVHLAFDRTTTPFNTSEFSKLNIFTYAEKDIGSLTAGETWKLLVSKVTTPYTFIGRDLTHFTNDTRFERLILAAETLNASYVGGAWRTPDGHWNMGCHQSLMKNWTLSYRAGYFHSQNECVFCSHLTGPFLAETKIIRTSGFDSSFSSHIVFEDFFLDAQSRSVLTLSCPDAMFHIEDTSTKYSRREVFIPFVGKFKINVLKHANGVVHRYDCSEAKVDSKKTVGFAVAPCCLQNLADIVNFFMTTCKENNFLCELQEGTLLGALKFNKVLPWERDADLAFHTANYTALGKLKDKFVKRGYSFDFQGDSTVWCCVDGRKAGGKIHIMGKSWSVETAGSHMMDSELLIQEGMSPTKVFHVGQWVGVPRNPGLHARNRYGKEIYRHAQHWMSMKKTDGYTDYQTTGFTPCTSPGHHACLDQYLPDGNIQFEGDDL